MQWNMNIKQIKSEGKYSKCKHKSAEEWKMRKHAGNDQIMWSFVRLSLYTFWQCYSLPILLLLELGLVNIYAVACGWLSLFVFAHIGMTLWHAALFPTAALRQSKLMKKFDFSGIQSDSVRWFVVLRQLSIWVFRMSLQ